MDPRPDSLQIATKKVVHEVCECLGNKITDAVTKPNDDKNVKQRNEILHKLKKILQKWNTTKYLNY